MVHLSKSLIQAFVFVLFLFTIKGSGQEFHEELNVISSLPKTDTGYIMELIRNTQNDINTRAIRAEDAIPVFQQALSLSRKTNFDRGIAHSLCQLGICFRMKGLYTKSIELFKEGIPHAIKADDKRLLASLYYYTATSYYFLARYDYSTFYYYKTYALISGNDLSMPEIITNVFQNLGGLWLKLNNPDKGLIFLNNAENIASMHCDSFVLAFIYSNKGSAYMLKADWNRAMNYYFKAMKLGKKYGDTQILHAASSNIGDIYMRRQMPEKAIPYLHNAIRLSNNTLEYNHRILSRYNLGEAYYMLKDYKRAEAYLRPAIEEAEKTSLKENMEEAHTILASIYAATGRYKQAFEHQRQSTYMNTLKKENVHYIKQLEIKYETAEKDREIAENKLLITDQQAKLFHKNIWLWSITIGAIICVIITAIFYVNKQKRIVYKMRIMKQEEEIKAWQATIKGEEKERSRIAYALHDGIGGQLSTLGMYFGTIQKKYPVLKEATDYKDAMGLLMETLNDVRRTAHNMMPELLLRYGLAEAIRLYCKKVQTNQNLRIDFQYYGYIAPLNHSFELSIYRIIQELVQNILKHAQATEALVQLSQHDNFLSITVEDNGSGFDHSETQHSGMGLRSIETRTNGMNGCFTIHSARGNGTAIYLEFDLEDQESLLKQSGAQSDKITE